MANALDLFPARVPFVDPRTGLLTTVAQRALAQLLVRVGGPVAPTINELTLSDDEDSGLEELRHEFGKALQGLMSEPAQVTQPTEEYLITQVASMHAQIAELRKELEDMKQGQML